MTLARDTIETVTRSGRIVFETRTFETMGDLVTSLIRKRRVIYAYYASDQKIYHAGKFINLSSIERKCRKRKQTICEYFRINQLAIKPTHIEGTIKPLKNSYVLMPNTPEILQLLKGRNDNSNT